MMDNTILSPGSNSAKELLAVLKQFFLGSTESLSPLSKLSTQISVPISELQQLISFKVGFPLPLKIVDNKTVAVEKRVGGAIIGHTFSVSAKITAIQNTKVRLALSGSDLILNKVNQIQHSALEFAGGNQMTIYLDKIEPLQAVWDKVELADIRFYQNNVVVDVKVKMPNS